MGELTLFDHQLKGVEFFIGNPPDGYRGHILGDDMGTGKTIQSLAFGKWGLHTGKIDRVVVVCPSGLVCNWQNEIENYYGFAPYTYHSKKPCEDAWVTLVGLETLRYRGKDGIFRHVHRLLEHLKGKRYLLIVDEAHEVCNVDSGGNMALRAFSPKRVLLMTGTPIQNKLEDLYGLLYLLNPRLDRNDWYNKYVIRNLKNIPTRRGTRTVWQITGYKNIDHVNALLKGLMIRRTKEETLDLPRKMVQYIPYEPDRYYESKLYDIELSDEPKMVKVVRLVEACSGLDPFDKTKATFYPGNKYNTLKQLLLSTHGRIVVWFQYVEVLNHVKKLLEKAGFQVFEYSGRNTNNRNQQAADWKLSNGGVLCSTLDAGGVGINLVEGTTAIFFEPSLSPAKLLQAEDRIYRHGQTKPVTIIYLYGRETVEECIFSLLRRKRHTINVAITVKFNSEELQEIYKYSYKLEYK